MEFTGQYYPNNPELGGPDTPAKPKAHNGTYPCTYCGGYGWVPKDDEDEPSDCPACNGTGKTRGLGRLGA